MNKCILVGNSSSALNKELGLHIDSFENVIRFNRFRIKEYETDLGVKCTHWVLNYKLATDNRNYLINNLLKVKSETTDLKQALVLTTSDDKGLLNKIKKQADIDIIYERFEPPFNSKPTTGLLAIKYFLNYFFKITLVGFDFGKSNHYWGNHNLSDVPGNHEWDKEKHHIYNLSKQGKIEII
tara:strand:- start:1870 stop:2415 length:546 start_codon:yes stop_codon:yes gene_type:complete